jgi:hypothetical protein
MASRQALVSRTYIRSLGLSSAENVGPTRPVKTKFTHEYHLWPYLSKTEKDGKIPCLNVDSDASLFSLRQEMVNSQCTLFQHVDVVQNAAVQHQQLTSRDIHVPIG